MGIIFAAHPLAEIVMSMGAAVLCQKIGRQPVFQAGLMIVAASLFLLGMAHSLPTFMFLRLLEGAGSSCVQVCGLDRLVSFYALACSFKA